MKIDDLQAEFFKAMANPIKIKILDVLKKNGCCVSDVVLKTGGNQPQVSRNLIALKQAGILVSKKNGTNICYEIKDKEIFKLMKLSKKIIRKANMDRAKIFE